MIDSILVHCHNVNTYIGEKTMATLTQNERILSQLESGKTLTSAQARSRGIMRLAARIHELREQGYRIQSTPYTTRDGFRAVKYGFRA